MGKNEKLKERADMARHRSNIYSLLAVTFREEPTSAFIKQFKNPEFLDVLSSIGIKIETGFLKQPEEKLLEDLSIEYARLFLGPGKHISPHESVHHERDDGDWGRLWGKSTVEVQKFIESTGLTYKPEYSGIPDHISVELEFMQELTKREAEAWEEDDINGALSCLNIEKRFIDEHLIRWIPILCEKVILEADLSFYIEIARLTKSFIQSENKELEKYLVTAQNA